MIKNILKLIFVFIIFFKSYLFQYIPIILFKIDVTNISNSMSVLLNTFANIILVLIFFLIYRKDLVRDFKKFKSNLLDNINIGFSYWIIGLLIMIISNTFIVLFFKAGGAANEQTVQKMISSLPLIMLIDAGFIAPFNEEIVFRKTLKDVLKNVPRSVGAKYPESKKKVFDLVPPGGYWKDLAYYKTDTVFTSMSMHMFHNFILTLFSIIL